MVDEVLVGEQRILLLRFWNEAPPDVPPLWRGVVREEATGRSRPFQRLETLPEVVAALIEQRGGSPRDPA